MKNIGLADLKEKGREDGEKAAIQSLFGPPMMKLGNDPDKQAYIEGFKEGVLSKLKDYFKTEST